MRPSGQTDRWLTFAGDVARRHPDTHPWEVAVLATNWTPKADLDALLVGLLHDSLEDGYCTVEELIESGLPEHVVQAVLTLTRGEGEGYWEYIARVRSGGSLAVRVKLADAHVNLLRCPLSLRDRYSRVIKLLGEAG